MTASLLMVVQTYIAACNIKATLDLYPKTEGVAVLYIQGTQASWQKHKAQEEMEKANQMEKCEKATEALIKKVKGKVEIKSPPPPGKEIMPVDLIGE